MADNEIAFENREKIIIKRDKGKRVTIVQVIYL